MCNYWFCKMLTFGGMSILPHHRDGALCPAPNAERWWCFCTRGAERQLRIPTCYAVVQIKFMTRNQCSLFG